MKRTLITGAAGFTGRYLATHLAQLGHQVHGIVHRAPDSVIDGVEALHEADLADMAALSRIIGEVQPHHVVHLAAIAFVAHGDVQEMYRTNIFGTRQLLQALGGHSGKLQSVLLASSANIYGNRKEGILTEDVPPEPANDYGLTKLAMERVADLYRSKLPVIVVRPFNYTGRGQSTDFLIPKIVAHARMGAAEIELGNLDVARDFSDVRTVVDAYARLLECEKALGGTYNVCSGRACALREVVAKIEQLSGHHLEVRVNPAFVRADEVRTLSGSPARIEGAIGQLKHIPLEETLSWMLDG